jgi:hypothetical protein
MQVPVREQTMNAIGGNGMIGAYGVRLDNRLGVPPAARMVWRQDLGLRDRLGTRLVYGLC